MPAPVIRILLIEDEAYDARRVIDTLRPVQSQVAVTEVIANGDTALEVIAQDPGRVDVVIMDFQLAGGTMGEDLIRAIKRIDPSLQIIVVTKMTINVTDFDFANRLLRAGAFWYCTKYPGDIDAYIYQPTDFILSIFNAYQKRLLEQEQIRARMKFAHAAQSVLDRKKILGVSPQIDDVRRQIEACAISNAPVLVTGPSGTGKELAAQHIHYSSARSCETFIPINCGSIPKSLMESELFGYERGAFTGATQRKLGLFEVANHGTIFLDEIAELPLTDQVKLLRVLEEGEIEKIGRTQKIKVDVRIIAATNKNLREEVEQKRFREDLFYRLSVVEISLPALSERRMDIPVYIDHYLAAYAVEMNRPVPLVEEGALDLMMSYDWPGNVRELKNILQRLLFWSKERITPADVMVALPGVGKGNGQSTGTLPAAPGWLPADGMILPWDEVERAVRRQYFEHVRAQSVSDADAARKLGLAPPNYHRMCKELGLKS